MQEQLADHASYPLPSTQDLQATAVAISMAAGLLASSLPAPAGAFEKDANGVWIATRDDPDGQLMIKTLNELKVKKDAATAAAKNLATLSEQKTKALELYKKLDEERNKEIAKLEDTIKKNQATREYVLKDLEKRLGEAKGGDTNVGEQIAAAKKSFEDFYKTQIEKENKVKQRYDKERATRALVTKDIVKTRQEAQKAAEQAQKAVEAVLAEEEEMTDRVFPS